MFKHFPVVGQESLWAAEATECAADQGKFWAYHDYLFEHQQGENRGTFARTNLKQIARTLGMDVPQFNACLDTRSHDDRIQADIRDAQQRQLPGTPAFLVNGQFIGSQNNADVLRAVQQAAR
jgi:protein-disulfide isomerase